MTKKDIKQKYCHDELLSLIIRNYCLTLPVEKLLMLSVWGFSEIVALSQLKLRVGPIQTINENLKKLYGLFVLISDSEVLIRNP